MYKRPVLPEIRKVRFQVSRNFGVRVSRVAHPKLAVHAVAFDEVFFAVKDETWEATLLISFNNLDLQQRCFRVERVMCDKGFVGDRRVLKPLFFEIQIAKVAINHIAVMGVVTTVQKAVDGGRTIQVGEADAQYTEGGFY